MTLGIIPLATVSETVPAQCSEQQKAAAHQQAANLQYHISVRKGRSWGRAGLWSSHCPSSIAAMAGSCSVGVLHIRRKQKDILKRKSLFLTAEIILTTLKTKSKSSMKRQKETKFLISFFHYCWEFYFLCCKHYFVNGASMEVNSPFWKHR